VAIRHELDQPSSGLTNKEIMSGQFADRFEIKLISEKIKKFYQRDLYTSKEIIEYLKHFFFNPVPITEIQQYFPGGVAESVTPGWGVGNGIVRYI
jgi:hypothetical protein